MSIIGEPLFFNRNHVDINAVARHQYSKLRETVDKIPQNEFDSSTDDEVVEKVVNEMRIEPLEVDFQAAEKKVEETSVAVRDYFSERPVQVPGLRAMKIIPFKGDKELWQYMTGSWSSMMPYGEVQRGRLIVGMEVRVDRGEDAKQHIEATIRDIGQYLAQQRVQIDAYNDGLSAQVRPLVEERRKRRGAASSLLADL